jgi:hypothetical protein
MTGGGEHADQAEDEPLAVVLAMVEVLDSGSVAKLARALHAKLNRPVSAAERRVSELLFLAQLLGERPQHPENLPYVPRNLYDERRARDRSLGPSSGRLQAKLGSWPRTCHAAWGLLEDGRSWGPGQPWVRPPQTGPYRLSEAVASVRACGQALNHIPSSSQYHAWVLTRRARARAVGASTRPFVHYASVMRVLAPERKGGNGWRLVCNRVFEQQEGVAANPN